MAPTPRAAPTIADVAREAGVSRTTVSHALAGKGRVDPTTRQRVQLAAQALGYRPSVRAQRLRAGRSQTLALLTALPPAIVGENSEMGFLIDVVVPAARECLRHGYSMLLVPPGAPQEHLDGLDVDGVIVLDPRQDDATVRSFLARGVTVVAVGEAGGNDWDGLVDRGLAGSDVMLDHLHEVGARRIGVIVSTEPYSLSAMLPRVLAAHGWRWREAKVALVRASAVDGVPAGRAAAEELLRAHPDLDAVYAPLDAFAVGALEAVRARGLAVPQQVRIATNYDGFRAAGTRPTLTVLDLDLPRIGQIAVDLLVRLLAGEEAVRAPAPTPRVIARASTVAGGADPAT